MNHEKTDTAEEGRKPVPEQLGDAEALAAEVEALINENARLFAESLARWPEVRDDLLRRPDGAQCLRYLISRARFLGAVLRPEPSRSVMDNLRHVS